ncbi:serine/threonine-protein kinase Sgk1-like [Centruroides sculpturatus]|uniref:serine/threonine-protein kinase Sgk1-like n=1 Tax=Centruroides sculpturatus TaxID=218467 RepID=UPI000C6D90AE|nr:serine/threonine-protein kinase Sgk1-like [Centruroides sculpturatus]
MIGAQVASAIMYIHNRGIIHRDIGSNNVMLDKSKGAQLIDFGLCTYEQNPKQFCGTFFYLCPEILEEKPYDAYCDWWAFGILLYQMFIEKTPMEMYLEKVPNIDNVSFMEIIKIAQNVRVQYFLHLSINAMDVIDDLLEKDPVKRLQETDITRHMFFHDVPWPQLI